MSTTQAAIDFIKSKGVARTHEIAAHIKRDGSWVGAALANYVTGGTLVVCKVTTAGNRQENEYRISASGRPHSFVPGNVRGKVAATPVPAEAPRVAAPKPAAPSQPATQHHAVAPKNDGAYAAVLSDLKRKREKVAADAALEIQRIDAAMLAIEALA